MPILPSTSKVEAEVEPAGDGHHLDPLLQQQQQLVNSKQTLTSLQEYIQNLLP